MGRPVDRAEGVVLITDYGTADQLMSDLKRKRGDKERAEEVTPVAEQEFLVEEEETPVAEEETPVAEEAEEELF